MTQPENEKIIKLFTSSISNYFFLLTKLNNNFKVYGFGENEDNQLGIFEENNCYINNPMLINSLKNLKIKKIICSEFNTFVLEKNNNLFGFGNNCYNQLGIESYDENKKTKGEIKEICFFKNKNEKVKKISLNSSATIFLTSFLFIFFF